jgi:uncharacterized peroxidase-related enzyme
MTGDSNSRMSWLDLGEPKVTPEVQAVMDGTRSRLGYVRTGQTIAAHVPDAMVAQDGLSRGLMLGDGPLSRKERELLALVVSVENRCMTCIFGHSSQLRLITGDPLWVGEVEANYRHARLTPREMALADYAVKLTRAPGDIREDLGILYTAQIVAYYNFSNRFMSGIGVRPNPESYAAGR